MYRLPRILVVIATLGTCLTCGGDCISEDLEGPRDLERILGQTARATDDPENAAEKALSEHRFQAAITLYSRAAKKYPHRSSIYVGRGTAYELANRPNKAEKDFQKAVELDPGNYRAMENLAGMYERSGKRIEEAIDLYKRALERDPRPEWKESLAVWIKMLESRLQPDSSSAVALWHQGNKATQNGKLHEAETFYSRAIELNPLFFQAYYKRGLLRLQRGDIYAGLADLDTTIHLSPGFRGALVQRGLVYEHLGDRQQALKDLKRATEVDARDPHAHYQLGRILEQDEQFPEALESYQEVIRLKPKVGLRTVIQERISSVRRPARVALERRAKIRKILKEFW